MKKGKLIVISGPSGVGKGTLCNMLIKDLNVEYSVSYTTRNPREGEIDGVNYNFITVDEFREKIRIGDLLEYNIYNGNYYGTSKSFVMNKINEGKSIILEIDVNGARNVKNIFPDALLIYIAPPSIEELKRRLINRGTESIEKINSRLEIAKEELEKNDFFDYVIINDVVDEAYLRIKRVVEKNRYSGSSPMSLKSPQGSSPMSPMSPRSPVAPQGFLSPLLSFLAL